MYIQHGRAHNTSLHGTYVMCVYNQAEETSRNHQIQLLIKQITLLL